MEYDRDENDLTAYIPCRKKRQFIPENKKDELYWEKRRKNNAAARRSREKRRYSDMALETRIVNISRDNKRLRIELAAIKRHFGIPLNEAFVSNEAILPPFAHGFQHLCSSVSPPYTPSQYPGSIALLGQVEHKTGFALSRPAELSVPEHCPCIKLPSLDSYTITNVQIPPFHSSILPLDYSRRNIPCVQSEMEPRCCPVKAEPPFYQESKLCCEEEPEPITMPGRNGLTEKAAYFHNIPRSLVPPYTFSLTRTSTSESITSSPSCSSNEGDRKDETEEGASPFKDER